MIFYVFPQSLALRTKTQGGAGGGTSLTTPSPAPLSQGEVVDDANRVTIDARKEACPRSQYRGGNAFKLIAQATPVAEPHGTITKVEILTRAYRSENGGGDDWCRDGKTFPAGVNTDQLAAFLCPFLDVDALDPTGDPAISLPASAYDWNHDSHNFITGQVSKAGYRVRVGAGQSENFKDFSSGSSVSPSIPKAMTFDVTSLATWDDAKIAAVRFGLSSWDLDDSGFVGGQFWSSGVAQGGSPSSNTPRWNVSQLVLRVTADDPPGAGTFIFMED